MISAVCHIDYTRSIHRHAMGPIKRSSRAHSINKSETSRASQGSDQACKGNTTHAVANVLCHQQGHRDCVNRNALQNIERRRSALSISPPSTPTARQRAHIPVARRLRAQPCHWAGSGGSAGQRGRGAAAGAVEPSLALRGIGGAGAARSAARAGRRAAGAAAGRGSEASGAAVHACRACAAD